MTVKGLLTTIALSFILNIWTSAQAGQPGYSIDEESRTIYRLISELRFDEANSRIKKAQGQYPENLFYVFLENYIDFYTVLITEDKAIFETLETRKAPRLKQLKKGDPSSPFHLLLQAEIHMQWALARLKFGENFTAAWEIRTAYGLLIENSGKHPEFILNNKGLSMIHAAIGTIPEKYHFLIKILTGLEGNIKLSNKEATELVSYCSKNDHLFLGEAEAIHSFIQLFFNNEAQKAWQVIEGSSLDPHASPLAAYVYAIVAQRSGRTDKAIELLEDLEQSPDQEAFLYLEYMLGLNKLRKLDPTAKEHLWRFTKQYKGYNYIKKAYQLLAWHSLVIEGNENLASSYYQACLEKGQQLVDSDKSAYVEAKTGELPDPLLLKMRLLFDGGYYQASMDHINANTAYLSSSHPVEYHYRKARNYQAMERYHDALREYGFLLARVDDRSKYQICNAALQSGIIYETLGNMKAARSYYEKCLELDPDSYKDSLHVKARAGLQRLEG
jgi:tetratricopeptide (TPR) repeat protein